MQNLDSTNWGQKFVTLGYHLSKDDTGLVTSPISGSGAVCHHTSLTQLREYYRQIVYNREMETADDNEWLAHDTLRQQLHIYPYHNVLENKYVGIK